MPGFTFNPVPFNPQQFGQFNTPQFPAGFNPDDLSFSNQFTTPNTGASIDTSNIGFGPNNTPQFGTNGSGFNLDNQIASNGVQGFDLARLGIGALQTGSGIIDAIQRRKNLKLARDAFNLQKTAFNKNFKLAEDNFKNQVTTVNNRINDQNAFKTAQGRTDLAKLVV